VKIFLAGATGVVGRALLPLLAQAGHEVSRTTRNANQTGLIQSLGARPVVVDVFDREGVFAALRAERPDMVMHQLTDLSGRDFPANSRLRIEGTRNLVDAAPAVGVQRLIAQSISWMYAPGEGPAHEEEPLDLEAPPLRRGAVEAVAALEQAISEVPEGVVLRYGLFYGPGTWYARDGWVADRVRRGEIATTAGIVSFIHVEDAARAALLALDWQRGLVNIVDDEPASGKEWLPVFAAAVGAPPPPVKAGSERGERGASNAKARRELGWQPLYPPWREGFKTALG
jgi:nucleoside-diphosphate-sugar epimerase